MASQTASDYTNDNSSSDKSKKTLYLSGLSLDTDNEGLSTFFSRFGKVKNCHVMLREEGKSRCCAFLNYENVSSVDECMRLRPHIIDGQQIFIKRAMPRRVPINSGAYLTVKKLFVTALRYDINEANLQEYFSRFGNVTDVYLIKDGHGQLRGSAYVLFDDYDAVDKVILQDSHSINGQLLDVRKAIPKKRLLEIKGSYESKSRPSSNNNNAGNINDTNWDNQTPHPSYNQQGYNSNRSNMNGDFSSSYNSIRPNQPPPLPESMMNRHSYDGYQDMPFNNNVNRSSISNSMPPSYEKNRQQYYDVIPNDFSGMNNRFNQPAIHKSGEGSSSSFLSNSFDNSNSYGATSHNYDTMPREQSRGGGPMHRGRGRRGGRFQSDKLSDYANHSATYSTRNSSSTYNNRSAPYPTRGSLSNYRSRGRGQLNKK